MSDKPQFLRMSNGVKMSVRHAAQIFVLFLHVPKCFKSFNLAPLVAYLLTWCSIPKNDCFLGSWWELCFIVKN